MNIICRRWTAPGAALQQDIISLDEAKRLSRSNRPGTKTDVLLIFPLLPQPVLALILRVGLEEYPAYLRKIRLERTLNFVDVLYQM